METTYQLTSQQLYSFLHEVLELTDDDMALLQSNRLRFLHQLNKAYDSHIPFQNLNLTSVPFDKRHFPTMQENVDAVLSGIGGTCWTLNSVLFVILKELTFDVDLIVGFTVRYPHLMVIVSNVEKPGDKFLMDVGFGSPAHDPIPLNFEEESPLYPVSHLVLRWLKKGDQYIRQEHYHPENGCRISKPDGDWEDVNVFTLQSKSLDICYEIMKMDPASNPLNTYARMIGGKNKVTNKVIWIDGLTMKKEGLGRTLQQISLQDDEAVVQIVKKYFPQFPAHIVYQSYKMWYLYDRKNEIESRL